jgi:hypothetical protein
VRKGNKNIGKMVTKFPFSAKKNPSFTWLIGNFAKTEIRSSMATGVGTVAFTKRNFIFLNLTVSRAATSY